MPVKLWMVAATSLLLTAVVIGNAFYQKQQFYPSVVYLTRSNISLAVVYVQSFVIVFIIGKLLRFIFFGQLRPVELERLTDRGWYAVMETCMAFTMFRNDLSPQFVAMFTLLLFLKAFHWLTCDRIDLMARSTVITKQFHIRAVALICSLSLCNLLLVRWAYNYTMANGVSVQLIFGFEYAILLTVIFNVLVKYVLYTIDARRETPWEHKAELLLYTELVGSLAKLFLYLLFIVLMVRVHTIPIFSFRPMYSALRSFQKEMRDVVLSRRAINIMNTLYEDASAEDLSAGDNVCIICREEMTPASRAKRLPCAHMFHAMCLRSWFQRQQTCPTCRMDILRTPSASSATNNPAGAAANNNNNTPDNNQQQQQQQQAPAAAGAAFNPNMLNWMSFNMAAAHQFAMPAQPPVSSSAATGATSTTNTSTTTPAGSAGVNSAPWPFPNIMPPLPFPPVPASGFSWPRPPSLEDLTALSEHQLRQMEGSQRAAVEARLQLLSDISTLVDAAAVLMQQYRLVAPSGAATPETTDARAAAASSDAPTASPQSVNTQPASESSSALSASASASVASSVSGSVGHAGTAGVTAGDSSSTQSHSEPTNDSQTVDLSQQKQQQQVSADGDANLAASPEQLTPEQLLRQRRMRHFEQQRQQDQQQ